MTLTQFTDAFAIHTHEGDLIPAARREETRQRAKLGALGELESLLEFREDMDDWKAEGRLMQAYAEQAADMMIAKDTLRRKISTIRNYSAEDLVRWITAGAGFEHMETSNTLAELAKKTPKQLMDEAVDLGDGKGRVMTVDQLTAHALGEKPHKDPIFYRVNVVLDRLGKYPILLKWNKEKQQKFELILEELRGFFYE